MAIKSGDRVRWETSQGPTVGTAVEKRVRRFQHDKQIFAASSKEPYWIVESEKSGKTAAHKESSLTKA